MLVRVLEGLDSPDRLVHVPAHLLVVDGQRADLALAVDYEEPSQRGPVESVRRILDQHAVAARDVLGDVRQQRDVDLAESALVPGRVLPGQMGEVGVD